MQRGFFGPEGIWATSFPQASVYPTGSYTFLRRCLFSQPFIASAQLLLPQEGVAGTQQVSGSQGGYWAALARPALTSTSLRSLLTHFRLIKHPWGIQHRAGNRGKSDPDRATEHSQSGCGTAPDLGGKHDSHLPYSNQGQGQSSS